MEVDECKEEKKDKADDCKKVIHTVKITKNMLLHELYINQIDVIPITKKLQYNDFKRIVKNIDSSIFNNDECCLWKGKITNSNKPDKGMYINFFFRDRKIALHRLLYINFVKDLRDDEYLKFSCHNHGKCCNINHLAKYKPNENKEEKKKVKNKQVKEEKKSHKRHLSDLDSITISFD